MIQVISGVGSRRRSRRRNGERIHQQFAEARNAEADDEEREASLFRMGRLRVLCAEDAIAKRVAPIPTILHGHRHDEKKHDETGGDSPRCRMLQPTKYRSTMYGAIRRHAGIVGYGEHEDQTRDTRRPDGLPFADLSVCAGIVTSWLFVQYSRRDAVCGRNFVVQGRSHHYGAYLEPFCGRSTFPIFSPSMNVSFVLPRSFTSIANLSAGFRSACRIRVHHQARVPRLLPPPERGHALAQGISRRSASDATRGGRGVNAKWGCLFDCIRILWLRKLCVWYRMKRIYRRNVKM